MEFSDLACVSCQYNFNITTHTPYIIPTCGHSICQKCLTEQIEHGYSIICSEDMLEMSTKGKTLIDFPKNHSLINILKKNPAITVNEEDAQKDDNKQDSPLLLREEHTPERDVSQLYKQDSETDYTRDRISTAPVPSYVQNDQNSQVSYTNNNPSNTCRIHQRRLEIVCLEDNCRQLICYQCGLLGEHKVS